MPPKLSAAEIEARDAARLNELGYKQVSFNSIDVIFILQFFIIGIKERIICKKGSTN
jgi:hypothetical protein